MLVIFVLSAYLIVSAAVCLLTEYSAKRTVFSEGFFKSTRIVRVVLYAMLAVLPFLGTFLPKGGVKYFFMAAGNIWLGYFLYYAGLMLFGCGAAAVICKAAGKRKGKVFGYIMCFSAAVALAVTVCGMVHAQDTKTVEYELKLSDAPQNELKAVLIADLHLSVNSSPEMTEQMVEKVNSCEPDMILIAGDR